MILKRADFLWGFSCNTGTSCCVLYLDKEMLVDMNEKDRLARSMSWCRMSNGSSRHQPAVACREVKGFLFYLFPLQQLQHINPGIQYNCQILAHVLTDGDHDNKLKTFSNSSASQQESAVVIKCGGWGGGGGGSSGCWSQPGLWQCETMAQQDLKDDIVLCAHTVNLPLLLLNWASLELHPATPLFGLSFFVCQSSKIK